MSNVTVLEVQCVTLLRQRPTSEATGSEVNDSVATAFEEIKGRGGESVIADLGHVEVDSDLLAILERAHAELASTGHRLVIVSSNEHTRNAIRAHDSLVSAESIDIAAGDLAPASDPTASPADHQRGLVPPLDPRGY